MVHSVEAVHWWGRVRGKPVTQNCGISPLQKEAKSTPEVAQHLTFLLPILPGKCCSQLLHPFNK